MLDFYSLFELAEIKAINAALQPSLESVWRMRCREYSTLFHTPLHVVMYELDPEMVLQALNEEKFPPRIVEEELEELAEILYKIKDPKYSRLSKEDLEEMVDAVLNREIARAEKKKKAPTQQEITSEVKAAEVKSKIPKSGGMNFSNLEKIDSDSEANGPGFKD
jgi:hypothetical protein